MKFLINKFLYKKISSPYYINTVSVYSITLHIRYINRTYIGVARGGGKEPWLLQIFRISSQFVL